MEGCSADPSTFVAAVPMAPIGSLPLTPTLVPAVALVKVEAMEDLEELDKNMGFGLYG